MDMPATSYAAIGAISAALITGIVSSINLITSKDNKISEFRQNWIDEIRSDVSKLLGHIDIIGANAHYYNGQVRHFGMNANQALDKFVEATNDDHRSVEEISHRIILRLNKTDNAAIINKIKELNRFIDGSFDNMSEMNSHKKITGEIISMFQTMLKDEWETVKRGEPSYLILKYIIIIALAFLFVTLSGEFTKHLTFKWVSGNPSVHTAQKGR